MKRALLSIVVLGLAGALATSQAQEKKTGVKETHLGLGVAMVPPALQSQLPNVLPKNEGVLVFQVEKDSPAAKAGFQPNDILFSFGEQKLHSPEQLVKLVRADKPGQQVTIGFVRGGKSMTSQVTLGSAEHAAMDHRHVYRFLPDETFRRSFEDFNANHDGASWQSFDSMKLTRTDDKHWRAEIEYRSTDGKKDTKTFTGTREEIRKQIDAEKDLPANEQRHLLRALNFHGPVFQFHFPALDALPSPSLNSRP